MCPGSIAEFRDSRLAHSRAAGPGGSSRKTHYEGALFKQGLGTPNLLGRAFTPQPTCPFAPRYAVTEDGLSLLQFLFRGEPILNVMAMCAAALLVKLVGAGLNSLCRCGSFFSLWPDPV